MTTSELMRECYLFAEQFSHDPTSKIGALVTIGDRIWTQGTNRFPHGVAVTPERITEKKLYMIHAEEDAVFAAAFEGKEISDRVMYCVWKPCLRCARAIIASGINSLVTHKEGNDRIPISYREEIALAMSLLEEAGVDHVELSAKLGGCTSLMNGESWKP